MLRIIVVDAHPAERVRVATGLRDAFDRVAVVEVATAADLARALEEKGRLSLGKPFVPDDVRRVVARGLAVR